MVGLSKIQICNPHFSSVYPNHDAATSCDQSAISTLLGALSSGGPTSVSAAERAVTEAERDGGWPRGILPAVCYFNLLDVAHQAGDKAGADRISSLIRPVPNINPERLPEDPCSQYSEHSILSVPTHKDESDTGVIMGVQSARGGEQGGSCILQP
jgi:hypothetical protein